MSFLDKEQPAKIEIISGAFMFVSRKALEACGSFDEDFFMYGEDIDLSYRILKGGFHNFYLPLPILHYKGESTQKSSYRYVHVFYEAMLIFFQKHYGNLSGLFTFPIKCAIIFRAFVALIQQQFSNLFPQKEEELHFAFVGMKQHFEALQDLSEKWLFQVEHVSEEHITSLKSFKLPSHIKNLIIDNVTVKGGYSGNATAGILASSSSKFIDNVTITNSSVEGGKYTGGVVGYGYADVTNCTLTNCVVKGGYKLGGVIGYVCAENVTRKIEGNALTDCAVQGAGQYADGKSKYIAGRIVGNYNCNGTCENNVVENMTTIATANIGEIEAGMVVAGQNTTVVDNTSELQTALALGETVVLTESIAVDKSEAGSNGYGATGISQTNGGIIDGNGNDISVNAWTTWDSAINTTGGTIKNVNVTGGMRGIFINHNSTNTSKVILENVTIDGTVYTISCDQGTNKGLEAYNSTFNGWTSYAATIGDVKFVDCKFGEGQGYAYCRPYAPTEFIGCEFAAGFELDAVAAVSFENCTIGGVALTDANLSTLVTSGIANATVK
jgi:hypothetical protein